MLFPLGKNDDDSSWRKHNSRTGIKKLTLFDGRPYDRWFGPFQLCTCGVGALLEPISPSDIAYFQQSPNPISRIGVVVKRIYFALIGHGSIPVMNRLGDRVVALRPLARGPRTGSAPRRTPDTSGARTPRRRGAASTCP